MEQLNPSQRENIFTDGECWLAEGKLNKKILRESEELLRLALKAGRMGMWEWNLSTNEVLWSSDFGSIHGLAPGTFNGTFAAYQQGIHPEDREYVLRAIGGTVEKAENHHVEYRIIWPDGSIHWIEGRGKFFREQDGMPPRMIGICMDITERKRAEEALLEGEQRFARFMQNLPGLAWIKDLHGRYVYANDQAASVFQTAREKLYGKTDEDIFPAEVAARFIENDRCALDSGRVVQVAETLKHQDGTLHHSIVSKFPILGVDGRPVLVGGIAIDITDRKRAEDALRERDEQYDLIVAGAEAGIWDWNVKAKRVFFSSRWKDMRGLLNDEVSDHEEEWSSRIHPDDFERVMAAIQEHFEGRTGVFNEEYRIRHKDGRWIWIADRGIARRNQSGEVVRMAGSETNITQRKQAEEELRRLKDELEIRVQERTSELLVSQNRLRSLASQLSLTEERERRKLAKGLHDYLAQLLVVGGMKLNQAKKIVSLSPEAEGVLQDLENILQQALIYSRTTIAELSPPALHEVGLPVALKWLAERMEKHGLRVEVHPNAQPVHLPEDRAILLFQSVRELLYNVLKHAGVTQANIRLKAGQNGEVEISVEDRGKGLDADAMQRALEPGHLGLFAVRERIEAMGGCVELNSVPEQGTRVKLMLPVHGTSQAVAEKKQSRTGGSGLAIRQVGWTINNSFNSFDDQPLHPIRVLLVDDHDMIRQELQTLLKKYNDLEIVGEARDGAEAVALTKQLMPDVIVMDINMPRLNGIEATRQIIHQSPGKKIIGLSINDGKEVRAAMLEAGAVAYLTKNGSIKDLYQAICAARPA